MSFSDGEWEARGTQVFVKGSSHEILEVPVWGWMKEGEAVANARLIAAAPEMYEALATIRYLMDKAPNILIEHPIAATMVTQALAKVEGGE